MDRMNPIWIDILDVPRPHWVITYAPTMICCLGLGAVKLEGKLYSVNERLELCTIRSSYLRFLPGKTCLNIGIG